MKLTNLNSVWISWHKVPRSQNIAKFINVPLYEYYENDNIFKRHVFSSLWTMKFLFKNKPDIVFLHYSYLLLFIVAVYKKIFAKNTVIIADCHNKALRRKVSGVASVIYEKIKQYSFKNTDITIITNKGLIRDIEHYSKNFFILPDKIPDFEFKTDIQRNETYCVYISTFSVDEPLEEVIEAFKNLGSKVNLYWTGNKNKVSIDTMEIPNNIKFTGYLEYSEYYKLISNADCLLLLTSEDDCLQCGAYEGLNAGIPLVISDNKASREYFSDSAVYVKIDEESIAAGVLKAIENQEKIRLDSKKIKDLRENEFRNHIDLLKQKIELILE